MPALPALNNTLFDIKFGANGKFSKTTTYARARYTPPKVSATDYPLLAKAQNPPYYFNTHYYEMPKSLELP